jgi:3-dehydroquinate synthase
MAVSIDIAVSTAIAFELGLVSATERDRILHLLVNAGLPIYSSLMTPETAYRALEEMEAHRGGHLNLVLPNGVGNGVFIKEKAGLSEEIVSSALDFLRQETQPADFSIPIVSAMESAPNTVPYRKMRRPLPFLTRTGT